MRCRHHLLLRLMHASASQFCFIKLQKQHYSRYQVRYKFCAFGERHIYVAMSYHTKARSSILINNIANIPKSSKNIWNACMLFTSQSLWYAQRNRERNVFSREMCVRLITGQLQAEWWYLSDANCDPFSHVFTVYSTGY